MKKLLLLLCLASSSLFAQLSIDPVNPVCRNASPFNLSANQPGGYWSGWGISDPSNGTFNPANVPNYFNNVTVAYHIGNDSASAQISIKEAPSLWTPNTTISICNGQNTMLHAYQFNCTNVVWTGDANSTDTSITISSAGTYTVTGENNGCFSDPITFTVNIADTIKGYYSQQYATVNCASAISLDCGFNNATWNDNTQGNTIQVSTPGKYSYYINNNGCIQEGEFDVQQGNTTINLSIADEYACLGNSALLNTNLNPQVYNILWSTGETTSSINAPVGDYYVAVSKGNCSAHDTVSVLAANTILPINLHNDTTCVGSTVTLNSGYDAQQYTILWSTNETTSSIEVGVGTYSVTVSDGQCSSGQATVEVFEGTSNLIAPLSDVNSCLNRTLLKAPYANNIQSITWSDETNLLTTSNWAYANHTGTYYLHETLINGCEHKDTIQVTLGNLDSNSTKTLLSSTYAVVCAGESVTLSSTGTHTGYEWTKYDYYGNQNPVLATSQNFVAQEAGEYTLTVTDGSCSYSATAYVQVSNCALGFDANNSYLSSSNAAPGFVSYVYAGLGNSGNQILSDCTYELTFDDSKLSFDNTAYCTPGISVNGNIATMDIPQLTIGNYMGVTVPFIVNADVNLLGTSLVYTSKIVCINQEVNVNNNNLSFSKIIAGAYDPNFVASNYGDGEIADSTSYIKYDVGFQNTGTDTAHTIVVKNALDTSVFDLSTIKILGSTHHYSMGIDNDGMITWTFNNIMLPDSTVDEQASHGQIQFIIQLKDNLKVGTVLKDSANIYFDFNPPILTNTAYNKLVAEGSSVAEINKSDLNLSVYPNPSNENATIEIRNFKGNGTVLINFLDITGKEVLSPIVSNNFNQSTSIQFSTENLSNGLYLVKVTSENKTQSIQLLVQH